MADWLFRPLDEVRSALRARRVTARALIEEAIARHADFGAKLNAYKTWDPDGALQRADDADAAFGRGEDNGALQGIPVSVKDLYGVPGLPTFGGTPHRMPPAWEAEGPVVAALAAQHAVVTGKTHTVEFAYGGLGTNPHWGAPWNPWDAREHRAPGGSSAGAGVSLVEGTAWVALGTDTGGSVRVPAALTGTVGLKTTKDRWSTDGIVPLSTTLDTPGILTRTVADTAVAFADFDARLGGMNRALNPRPLAALRLAVTRDYFWDGQTDIADVVESAIAEVTRAGATVSEIAFPEAREAAQAPELAHVLAVEAYANVATHFPGWLETLDPNVRRRMEDGRHVPAVDYVAALARMRRLRAAAASRLSDIDAVLVPMVPVSPPCLADVAAWDAYRVANTAVLSHASVINRLGMCAITLPVGLDALGMPVGLQMAAVGGRDAELVEAALAAEAVLGTARERCGAPPLSPW